MSRHRRSRGSASSLRETAVRIGGLRVVGDGVARAQACAPDGLTTTVAPLSFASAAMPPAWSKCACELRMYLMSAGLKPSARMFASIIGAFFGSVPSSRISPSPLSMSTDERPAEPT
jgi:hypothetical protein